MSQYLSNKINMQRLDTMNNTYNMSNKIFNQTPLMTNNLLPDNRTFTQKFDSTLDRLNIPDNKINNYIPEIKNELFKPKTPTLPKINTYIDNIINFKPKTPTLPNMNLPNPLEKISPIMPITPKINLPSYTAPKIYDPFKPKIY